MEPSSEPVVVRRSAERASPVLYAGAGRRSTETPRAAQIVQGAESNDPPALMRFYLSGRPCYNRRAEGR